MVDHNTLASYSITNMGDVYVAFRWNGGGNQPSTGTVASTPSTLSTAKSTASFGTVAVQSSVDKSHSCMVTQVNDSTTPRLKTPCGHYITSEGLDQWIDNAIFQNGARKRFPTEVPCPACQAGWSLAWVQSACTLSETDRNRMLARLSKNAIRDGNEFKECPLCETILEVKSAVSQSEPAKIFCHCCSQFFCEKCESKWATTNSAGYCGNQQCSSRPGAETTISAVLKNEKSRGTISTVQGVPIVRGCPSCQTPIYHEKDCKHMLCKICGHEFCFICLVPANKGVGDKWKCGSAYGVCATGIAPIQIF